MDDEDENVARETRRATHRHLAILAWTRDYPLAFLIGEVVFVLTLPESSAHRRLFVWAVVLILLIWDTVVNLRWWHLPVECRLAILFAGGTVVIACYALFASGFLF